MSARLVALARERTRAYSEIRIEKGREIARIIGLMDPSYDRAVMLYPNAPGRLITYTRFSGEKVTLDLFKPEYAEIWNLLRERANYSGLSIDYGIYSAAQKGNPKANHAPFRPSKVSQAELEEMVFERISDELFADRPQDKELFKLIKQGAEFENLNNVLVSEGVRRKKVIEQRLARANYLYTEESKRVKAELKMVRGERTELRAAPGVNQRLDDQLKKRIEKLEGRLALVENFDAKALALALTYFPTEEEVYTDQFNAAIQSLMEKAGGEEYGKHVSALLIQDRLEYEKYIGVRNRVNAGLEDAIIRKICFPELAQPELLEGIDLTRVQATGSLIDQLQNPFGLAMREDLERFLASWHQNVGVIEGVLKRVEYTLKKYGDFAQGYPLLLALSFVDPNNVEKSKERIKATIQCAFEALSGMRAIGKRETGYAEELSVALASKEGPKVEGKIENPEAHAWEILQWVLIAEREGEIPEIDGLTDRLAPLERMADVGERRRFLHTFCAEFFERLGIPEAPVTGKGKEPAGGVGDGVVEPNLVAMQARLEVLKRD